MQAQANVGSATHHAVVEVAINGKVFQLVQDSLLMKEQHAKLEIMSPATGTQEQQQQQQLQYKFDSLIHDPLNWGQAAAPSEFVAMKDMAHDLREVKETVKRFYEAKEVVITGVNLLTVAEVAAVARRPEVRVVLDLAEIDAMERSRVMTHDISSNSSSVVCHRQRSPHDVQTREHHVEPRISTPSVFGESSRRVDTGQLQSCIAARAAMLVRSNTLMQLLPGFSGKFRWEILEAMEKLLNAAHDVTSMPLPERGSGTISSTAPSGRDDQVATFLSYIAGLLAGRPDQFRAVTENVEEEVSAIEDLRIAAGVEKALGLQPKELGSLTQLLLNGSNANIGSATLASTVCFDANVLVLLAEVLYDLFCELIMPRKPDQFAAAADPAIFTLGPQIECIRNTTHSIQREINSLNDNPIIDAGAAAGRDVSAAAPQLQYYAVGNNNIEGTRVPIGVSMDNLRLAIAGIGKSIVTQFSELISNEVYYNINSRFPYSKNVSRDPNASASLKQPIDFDDMMNKGAEFAMASYLSQLNYLANAPDSVTMDQPNRDNIVMNNRSSLDLVSARKTEEAIEILKLMSATFLVAARYCTSSSRRTYPLYNFVRSELAAAAAAAVAGRKVRQQQQLLPGGSQISTTTMTPELQDQIHKVYNAISEGRVIAPLLDCIQGWTETQAAGPFAHVCC
jgi:phenylalanine ammonia-lyase